MMRGLRRRLSGLAIAGVGLARSEVGLADKARKAGTMSIRAGGVASGSCGRERSGRLEAGEEGKVVGDDRGPDVSPEVVEPAPEAARQTIGALQA